MVFAVPVTEYVVGRQWYCAADESVVVNCLEVVVSVCEDVCVHCVAVGALCHPVEADNVVGFEQEGSRSVGVLVCP